MHMKISGGGEVGVVGDKEEDDTNKKIRLSEQSRISDRKVHVFKCATLVHQINT